MMYSRKFDMENSRSVPGGIIPPDYSGVAYRKEIKEKSSGENDNWRRPRRALYREDSLPQEPPYETSDRPSRYSKDLSGAENENFFDRGYREEGARRKGPPQSDGASRRAPAEENFDSSDFSGDRRRQETLDEKSAEKTDSKGFFSSGLSRLTKHSFTMEDLLLVGIILLLLNGDADSDILLLLGFLLLTGLS